MAFAGLIVSIAWLVIIGILELISDAGLTVGEILLRPFMGVIEWIYNKTDKRTKEEIIKEVELESASYKRMRKAQENLQKVYEKYGIK